MRQFYFKYLTPVLCTISFIPIIAIAADGESIMVHGASNPAALPCITCHAPDGKGMPASGFPRLAGMPADYIAKQLRDFRAGTRENPIMQPIASALSDEEISAVANAYAARPKVNVATPSTDRPIQGTGAWIALRGAWDRNIPECTLCHGPAGVGVGSTFPPLAGQSAMYLETQLKAWKGKADSEPKRQSKKHVKTVATRRNDPNGLMQHIAADLTDAEIKAVAAYFASFGDSNEPFDDSQHRLR